VTVIENPGGSNERFARANFKQAKIVIFDDNTTIFDEILKGNADVMISESVETIVQQKLRPGPVRGQPDKPLQYARWPNHPARAATSCSERGSTSQWG
jgi:cyclohexadienyl dehydratase